jgi:hypothetical protein
MKQYIYGLIDPRDYKVRYVGRTTKRIDKRVEQHLTAARVGKPGPMYEWLRSLLPTKPWIVCHEVCDGLLKRKGRWVISYTHVETKWIKRYRRDCLNNLKYETRKRDWKIWVNPDEKE